MAEIQKFIWWDVNFCGVWTPMSPTFHVFEVAAPLRVVVIGHIGIMHRGNYPAGVGWGIKFGIRGPAPTQNDVCPALSYPFASQPAWIKGAKITGNIEPAALHYAYPTITGRIEIQEPGFYRLEGWGICHGSTAGPVLTPDQSVVSVNAAGGDTDPENNILYFIDPL